MTHLHRFAMHFDRHNEYYIFGGLGAIGVFTYWVGNIDGLFYIFLLTTVAAFFSIRDLRRQCGLKD